MKFWKKVLIAALPAALTLSFPAMAGQWKQDMNGWRYENNDGTFHRNGWFWVDGNNDGTAECYYFTNSGYAVTEGKTADGYSIDESGAWIVGGVVQTKEVAVDQSSNDPEAYALYMEAQEKQNALDSMDVDAAYTVTMGVGDTVVDMGMDFNMKMRGTKTGNLEYIMDGTTSMFGLEVPTHAFYTNGTYYMDMMGQNVKMAMPLDQALANAQENLDQVNVDAQYLVNMKMWKEGQDTVVSYNTNVAAMNKYLNGMNIMEMTGLDMADLEYDMREASGVVLINSDGYFVHQKTYMNFDAKTVDPTTGEDVVLSYQMNIEMKCSNPGEEAVFEMPSTEGYLELDTMVSGLE